MHDSAMENCKKFASKYCGDLIESSKVVDFGSYSVNGSLTSIFSKFEYIGIDISAGPNVDIVCNGQSTPFDNETIDVVVSSSNFEHDDCFWVTFLEMCRILKPGGLIYINAPSAGFYHGHPGDCWRFYADSWKALANWANKNSYTIELVESYVDKGTLWCDSVGIFKKTK